MPSPIVVGALLDRMAPACARDLKQNGDDGGGSDDFVVSPECQDQIPDVRWTLFLTCAWLSITVACFAAAWALAGRQYAEHHRLHGGAAAAAAGGQVGHGEKDDEKRRPLLAGEEGEKEGEKGLAQGNGAGGRRREIVL